MTGLGASPRDRGPGAGWLLVATALVCHLAGGLAVLARAAEASDAERQFTLKILPVLQAKCFGCHGDNVSELQGELNLLSREGMLRGGESGDPAIVPGDPQASPLMRAIRWEGLQMPPKENERLTAAQLEQIRQWIAAGAPWPDAAAQRAIRDADWTAGSNEEGLLVRTSGGSSEEWTHRRYAPDDLWAFRPVRTKSELLPRQPPLSEAIDHFVGSRLQHQGLTPAAPASPRELIRRATYDLLGLPPTPEEIEAFEAAWAASPDRAWEALVERLLASPRYGEHWGRHWLDVVRYADTGGMSNDYERSNMWRYRDYVIRAFNEDKPYDQFVVEQLAGDELADRSVQRRTGGSTAEAHRAQTQGDYTPQEAEWIVATGFLRMGPWDNAMVAAEEARQLYLDDLVNITGQAFLAQTLRCCKCHDHKFDPIPTRDYYRLYAAFATTQMAERPVPFLPQESREGFDTGRAHVERMLAFATAERQRLLAKQEAAAREWFEERGLPYQDEEARRTLPDEEKPPRHVGLDHVEQGQLKVREQDEWIWTRRLERYEPMAQSVYNAESARLAWNGARKLRIGRDTRSTSPLVSHILIGGALTAPGDEVRPGVLSAVGVPTGASVEDPYLVADGVEGRRLQLARWITRPDNSLTTRAIVNRVWQFHFGVGLAANANNFGAKGAMPTHPELLDYLAADFVKHGWTIKRLHRAIMLTATYRRSATPPDAELAAKVDPGDRLLSWFPRRRLVAEELRDAMLAVSGELAHAKGGLPVKPEINQEVALQPRMIQFSLAPAYQPSPTPGERNRRSVHAYHVRGQADPFMELFNQPNPNESCELRETAAVTPQALTMMNSEQATDRSLAFAQRLEREAATLDEQVARGFRLALGRGPTDEEAARMRRYVEDMRVYHRGVSPAPTSYPTAITRSLVEEFSGEPFEYQEILPVFEHYQPDVKPADVSPETRALADLCLLLFNTNEFMYVE